MPIFLYVDKRKFTSPLILFVFTQKRILALSKSSTRISKIIL